MDSWIRAREGQVQTSPWFNEKSAKPYRNLSKYSSSASMLSAKKTLRALPHSSSETGMIYREETCRKRRPAEDYAVRAILTLRLNVGRVSPASKPTPLTT